MKCRAYKERQREDMEWRKVHKEEQRNSGQRKRIEENAGGVGTWHSLVEMSMHIMVKHHQNDSVCEISRSYHGKD